MYRVYLQLIAKPFTIW